jgi:predicted RNA-binding protein YlqC (UPF0109 family)
MNDNIETLRSIIEEVVASFCRRPELLKVTATGSTRKLIVTVLPSAEDYGQVVGKDGKTIFALQEITRILCRQLGIEKGMLVLDNNGQERVPREPFHPDHEWTPDRLEKLAVTLMAALTPNSEMRIYWEPASETMTKMTMVTEAHGLNGDFEEMLSRVFTATGAVQGRRIVFELQEGGVTP